MSVGSERGGRGQIEILAGREIKMKSQRREGIGGGGMCVWVGGGGGGGGRVRMQEGRKTGRQGEGYVCVWVGGCECRTTERTTKRWGRVRE